MCNMVVVILMMCTVWTKDFQVSFTVNISVIQTKPNWITTKCMVQTESPDWVELFSWASQPQSCCHHQSLQSAYPLP